MTIKLIFVLSTYIALANCLYFVSIGDWGVDDSNQKGVARLMSNWCGKKMCQFIQGTGDNFYPDGAVSPKDPRFNTTWKNIYNLPNIKDLTWYQTLGNHDYHDNNEDNQLDYSLIDSQWQQPNYWYHYKKRDEEGTETHIIVIDSTALIERLHDPEGQIRWLEKTLAASTSDWVILVDHHPPYTVGGHASGDSTIRKRVVPLAEKYGVDIFLSGHDHNLQYIKKTSDMGIDYVISGGGGRGLYRRDSRGDKSLAAMGYECKYFGYNHGIVVFDIIDDIIRVDFVSQKTGVSEHHFFRHRSQRKLRK